MRKKFQAHLQRRRSNAQHILLPGYPRDDGPLTRSNVEKIQMRADTEFSASPIISSQHLYENKHFKMAMARIMKRERNNKKALKKTKAKFSI